MLPAISDEFCVVRDSYSYLLLHSSDAYEMPIAVDGGSPDAGKRVWYRASCETFVVGTAAALLAYLVRVVLRASWLDRIGHFTNNTGHADKIATA
jgi:hypothetical protein